MSNRKYPRIHQQRRLPRCEACGQPATYWLDVQFGWSRSDDESYYVCDADREIATASTPAFVDRLIAYKAVGALLRYLGKGAFA